MMKYTQLSITWNADPNDPMLEWNIDGNNLIVEFHLNYFRFEQFQENDKARLTFFNCYKYHFKGTNDEGYILGQHRYNQSQLPWGEFYELQTNWEHDFPKNPIEISKISEKSKLKHYIFFFRDETLECIAEDYRLEFISANSQNSNTD